MVPRAGVENPHEMGLSAINWGRIGGALLSMSYPRRSPVVCIFARRHGKAMEKEASYPPAARRASSNPARHVRSVLPNAEALHPAMRAASACRMPSTSTRRAAPRCRHQAEQYKTELFFPAGDVLIQQSAHPLWAAKLQPSFTLLLSVGAPRYRGWLGGRRWPSGPFAFSASHAGIVR